MAPVPWQFLHNYQYMEKFIALNYFCLYFIFSSYILYTIFFRLKKLNQNTFESTSTQVIVVSLYTYVIIYTYFVNKLFYCSIIICCAVFFLCTHVLIFQHSCGPLTREFCQLTFKTLLRSYSAYLRHHFDCFDAWPPFIDGLWWVAPLEIYFSLNFPDLIYHLIGPQHVLQSD